MTVDPAAARAAREALVELQSVEHALADAQARIPSILARAREARAQIEAVLPKVAAPKERAGPQ